MASCGPQIKAWCYYESRLLGAHHGLLSSYALEVLVLHICNLYHTTAATPLKVGCTSAVLAHYLLTRMGLPTQSWQPGNPAGVWAH